MSFPSGVSRPSNLHWVAAPRQFLKPGSIRSRRRNCALQERSARCAKPSRFCPCTVDRGSPIDGTTMDQTWALCAKRRAAGQSERMAEVDIRLLHDRTITVTRCGRICIGRRKINLSYVLAGQRVGINEVSEKIWLVSRPAIDRAEEKRRELQEQLSANLPALPVPGPRNLQTTAHLCRT